MSNPQRTRARAQLIALGTLVLGVIAAIAAGNSVLPAAASDVLRAFLYGAGGGAFVAAAMVLLTRGVSTMARGAFAILCFLGATLLTGSVLLAINKLGDESPPVAHLAQIKKKSTLRPISKFR